MPSATASVLLSCLHRPAAPIVSDGAASSIIIGCHSSCPGCSSAVLTTPCPLPASMCRPQSARLCCLACPRTPPYHEVSTQPLAPLSCAALVARIVARYPPAVSARHGALGPGCLATSLQAHASKRRPTEARPPSPPTLAGPPSPCWRSLPCWPAPAAPLPPPPPPPTC